MQKHNHYQHTKPRNRSYPARSKTADIRGKPAVKKFHAVSHLGTLAQRVPERKESPQQKIAHNECPNPQTPTARYIGLWPDGKLRSNDIVEIEKASDELRAVIDILITLNGTGFYTAFYRYYAHVGFLEIQLYKGRWGIFKSAIWEIDIDCREYPLLIFDTQKPFYAQDFLEWLILQIQ